jgi:hypothetical protein
MQIHRQIGLIATALAVVACESRTGRSSGLEVRDSAGVRIVVNHAPEWAPDETWVLDSMPTLAIGAVDGDAGQTLYRVSSVIPVGTDTVMIVNGSPAELRWYNTTGRLLHSAGGTGEGPGEFSRYGPGQACLMPASRVLVADPMQQRANVFAMTGQFLTTLRLTGDAAFPSIQGCFGDGSLLGWRAISPPERVPGTTIVSEFAWSRVDSTGSRATELVRVAGARQYLLENSDGSASYHTIPFTVRPSVSAFGEALYFTRGDAALVERRNLDGNVEAIIRWDPPRASSSEVYGRYREYILNGQDARRREETSRFFEQPFSVPDSTPVAQSLMSDAAGNLWVERYRLPWDSIPVWDVISAEDRWLGTVELPRGFQPMHIAQNAVYGIHRDSLGVERVHAYRIDRR